MNKFYLPTLLNIKIINYSLYRGNLDFSYTFVEGLNLIIGGNGVGKTTFLNIVKYAIIGLYKKELDTKTRLEARIDKRINIPYEYFKNRMDIDFADNQKAEVILTFKLNSTIFTVCRSLFDPIIKWVKIEENKEKYDLQGEPISQSKYDSFLRFDPQKINNTLQKQYEDKVASVSGLLYFDNIIFLINEILFFGENRKTIVWEKDRKEESSTQTRLASKYFNDPKLDNQRNEAERSAKYHDSLSRHYSEDMRAIQKVIDKLEQSNDKEEGINKSFKKITLLKEKIEKLSTDLDTIESNRKRLEIDINTGYSNKTIISQKIDSLYDSKKEENIKYFKDVWEHLHPKYHVFRNYIEQDSNCPICNQNMIAEKVSKIINNDSNCILCESPINATDDVSVVSKQIQQDIDLSLVTRRNIEIEILKLEEFLAKEDSLFNETKNELNQFQMQLRRLDYGTQKDQQSSKEKGPSVEFLAMNNRIAELELLKSKHAEESKRFRIDVQKIDKQIDRQRIDVRTELSKAFADYATQFLGVACELVYDDFGDGLNKRYLPKINGSVRKDEEELSESQRFFIDQSFRMSLLNFFYTAPTFFMCETPDSSLDISYEHNAAKIFLKFLEKPNSLIITSNLNNSEFLDFIIDKSEKIGFVNLLNIGRKSGVQAKSDQLLNASKRIEKKINAKLRNNS